MKKVLKSLVLLGLSAFFSIGLNSCLPTGLGEEVDLEAPVLKVLTLQSDDKVLYDFEGGVYCRKSITFTGTATDNNRVERVYARIKRSSDKDFGSKKYLAKLSGDSFSLDINFEDEDSYIVKIIAEDPVANVSPNSNKAITLYVDESAPIANAWYIDRELGGINYNLKSLEDLKNLNLDLPVNKDAAQNVAFTICAIATDTFGVNAISVTIKDESGTEITSIENSGSNNYAPKFRVTHEDLVRDTPSLASGKHYLQVFYSAEDVTDFPSSNSAKDVEVELGWFLWWPESDYPKITNTNLVDDSLNVHVKDTINLSLFDDDELDEAYFALLTEDEADSFTVDWNKITETPSSLIETVTTDSTNGENSDEDARAKRTFYFKADGNGKRETEVMLTAATLPQTMKLLAIAWDKTKAKRLVTKQISVRVTDESTPLLLISAPKNNSIPAINQDGIVTIEGCTLDSVGCTYLEFVWIPDSFENKRLEAKNWLETIDSTARHEELAKATNRMTQKGPYKLWSAELKSDSVSNGFYKHTFSLQVDLLNDFYYNNKNEQALDKYFLIKLTRKDGKYEYTEYKLAADTLLPDIVGVTPSSDMQIVQENEDLTLRFYAKKDSGLSIDTNSYRIERIDVSPAVTISDSTDGYSKVGYNEESSYYEATISSQTLTDFNKDGIRPKYCFYATDIFGNQNSERYTLVISDLPQLKSVSSMSSPKSKLGDKIDIIATFSKTVGISGNPRIKIKGISNTKTNRAATAPVYANYASGSGTTTIHFVYEVADGDMSSGVTLYDAEPFDDNNSLSLTKEKVILGTLSTEENAATKNNFDEKNIQVDGIVPTAQFAVNANGNVVDGISYIKEGSTLSVVLTMSEKVNVGTPSPTIRFLTSENQTLELPFTNISGQKITFSKKIDSDDANGELYYQLNSYITNPSSITDSFGNPVSLGTQNTQTDTKIFVDTKNPVTPNIAAKDSDGKTITLTESKYRNSVSFTLSKRVTDSTIKWIQYSVDGGSTWLPNAATTENTSVTLTKSASFTYRAIDFAGNVSEIPEPIYIDIESTFPDYTVECVDSDGNYHAGEIITLRLNFERAVKVSANSAAYITLSANDVDESDTILGGGNAVIKNRAAQSSESVDFVYTVKNTDQFTLKIAKNAVKLLGVSDEYGISGEGKELEADYARPNLRLDGVAPTIKSMTPAGETAQKSNIFANGNKITIIFSEPVLKASGNIRLRRAGVWAIPSVLSGTDFNKILNALPSDKRAEYKNILSLQENGKDMEDSEWIHGSQTDWANDEYHGTGQFVGPYKKSTQGILKDGSPDKNTKYVLDFDIDIWETTEPHYFGKTFDANENGSATEKAASRFDAIHFSESGELRTAAQIRRVLEEAHYHERILDVTSDKITVTKNVVEIEFPKGLCDESDDLPLGREWELLIDEGTFTDEAENTFATKTAIPTVNGGATFFSAGVATPVIRVDRYSYGLGIWQSDDKGNRASRVVGAQNINPDSVKPTGYVRTKIDCETPNVTINYAIDTSSGNKGLSNTATSSTNEAGGLTQTSRYSQTANIPKTTLGGVVLGNQNAKSGVVFASGNGQYNQACKQYVVAVATHANLGASARGYEGVFQTVVHADKPPFNDNRTEYTAGRNAGYADFSIRGTTNWSGEPSISPFPLRDAQVGSPFMRRCFRERSLGGNNAESNDYYWVSYEILVGSSFSGFAWRNYWGYVAGWGWMEAGEFTTCDNLRVW